MKCMMIPNLTMVTCTLGTITTFDCFQKAGNEDIFGHQDLSRTLLRIS